MKFIFPKEVSHVTNTLENAGFEAYLVGGCVRDLILNKKPKDWDITTNARPEDIEKLFENTFYENTYGTVGVVDDKTTDETVKVIEVTPYRVESAYTDKRRPDQVTFSTNILDDLKRRDFTINAIAVNNKGDIIDPYEGRSDINNCTIRAVGVPADRFNEDGLRILRAIRLKSELHFEIEVATLNAISSCGNTLSHISKERIRDELNRIIMSDSPMDGIILCQTLGILKYILPDIERGIGVEQNQAHSFDVWLHNLKTLQHSADKNWPLHIRLASLLHDVSKPETRNWSTDKKDWTFYGHDVVGARIAKNVLRELKYPNDMVDTVTKLVRWHMFFSDTSQITLSAVRRLISNVGKDNVWDLMNLRVCDRIGTGRPKESPYRLRKYRSMVEEVMTDPISVAMLKIDGNKIIEITGITPGPKIGHILHAILEDILDNPLNNNVDYLNKKVLELAKHTDDELKAMGETGKKKKDEEEEKKLNTIRGKHWVK